MTLREVFEHLGADDPRTDEAWSALDASLAALAARVASGNPDLQAELQQGVLLRLLLLRDRDALPVLESDGAALAYLSRALRNRYLDHVRGARMLEPMDTLASEASAPGAARQHPSSPGLGSNPEAGAAHLFHELDELFEHGLALEPQANRDIRLLGWVQIKRLALEPLDARQVLEATGQLGRNASQEDLERARTSMYKTHERVRTQLLAALGSREAAGEVSPEKAAELRERIRLLKRRQNRAARASSP